MSSSSNAVVVAIVIANASGLILVLRVRDSVVFVAWERSRRSDSVIESIDIGSCLFLSSEVVVLAWD